MSTHRTRRHTVNPLNGRISCIAGLLESRGGERGQSQSEAKEEGIDANHADESRWGECSGVVGVGFRESKGEGSFVSYRLDGP